MTRIFFIALALLLATWTFTVLPARAQDVVVADFTPTGAAPNLLLDDVTGGVVAYSVRKIDKDYAGSSLRVRRASDNAEQDIGFDGSGDLDTGSLSTFCSATSCFVTTWYDQTGGGVHAVQATAADQPRIVNSGTIDADGAGVPRIVFVDLSDILAATLGSALAQPFTVAFYMEQTSVATTQGIWGNLGGDLRARSATDYQMNFGANLRRGVPDTSPHLLLSEANSTSSLIRRDGADQGTAGNAGTNSLGTTVQVGGNGSGNGLVGSMQEFIVWNRLLTTDRATAETNIQGYF